MGRRKSDKDSFLDIDEDVEEGEDDCLRDLFNPDQEDLPPTRKRKKGDPEPKVDSSSTRFKNLVKRLKGITGEEAYDIQSKKLVYSTGCWALDIGLGRLDPETGCGGFAQGSNVEIFGDTGAGKSNLAENTIASIQRRNKNLWIAVLASEEPDYRRWEREGIDRSRVLVLDTYGPRLPESKYCLAEQRLYDLIEASRDPDCAALIVDSVKGLSGAEHVFEKGDMRKQKDRPMSQREMAVRAAFMEKFFNRLKIFNRTAICMMLNQLSESPDQDLRTGAAERPKTSGGRRMEFESQVRIKLSSSIQKEDEHDLIDRYRPGYAMKIYYDILKNRWSPEFNARKVNAIYNFKKCSFNNAETILDYGTYIDIFERKGNWYKLGQGKELVFNGRAAVLAYLEDDLNYEFLFGKYLEVMARHNDVFQHKPGHEKKKARSAFSRGELDPAEN